MQAKKTFLETKVMFCNVLLLNKKTALCAYSQVLVLLKILQKQQKNGHKKTGLLADKFDFCQSGRVTKTPTGSISDTSPLKNMSVG